MERGTFHKCGKYLFLNNNYWCIYVSPQNDHRSNAISSSPTTETGNRHKSAINHILIIILYQDFPDKLLLRWLWLPFLKWEIRHKIGNSAHFSLFNSTSRSATQPFDMKKRARASRAVGLQETIFNILTFILPLLIYQK